MPARENPRIAAAWPATVFVTGREPPMACEAGVDKGLLRNVAPRDGNAVSPQRMSLARLRLTTCVVALAAAVPCAGAQRITARSFDAILHTHRLLRAGDRGQGVRVGVISSGASFYATLARQDILPPVRFYGAKSSHGDEGDWMLQIVHRIAPGAQLAFCPGGPAQRTVACARTLVRAFHADIVVDDINPPPVYQFPTSKDIGYAKLSREHPDVLFFTGAGNNAGGYYQGAWTPTPLILNGTAYQAQDFGASMGRRSDPYERFEVPPGAGMRVLLGTNADPNGWPRCLADNPEVRLVLLDGSGQVLDSAHGRCPILTLSERHPPHGPEPLRLAVLRPAGARPAKFRLKLVAVALGTDGVSPLPLEYRTEGGAGNSATAANLVAVASVDPNTGWRQRYLYETFANAGPQCMDYARAGGHWTALPEPRCFRQPEFVAPDRMSVVMPGDREERYAPFTGDSAAAPAAAGVAALLLSAHVPASRVIAMLDSTAIPQADTAGWNAHYGYGLIDADAAAVKAGVLRPTAPAETSSAAIPLFHDTAAFLGERQLEQQAREGDRQALAQLRGDAQSGSADAQVWLARYEHDIGDEALAARWARAAADRGEPAAQSLLGSMYNRGWGVPMDPRAAQAWWWRAARAGITAAMFNMGTALAHGRGAPPNPELSYALMRTAFIRGMRAPYMLRAMALARLHMRSGQIDAAERLARRFAGDPGAIPNP